MPKRVIDVSHHQGEINWTTAKAKGVEAVLVRLAYGTTQDTRVSQYVPGLQAAGLELAGGYGYATWHYQSKCKGDLTAARSLMTAQVDRWLAIAKEVGLPAGRYLAIDQELESGAGMGLSRANNTTLLREAAARIRAAGYTPLVYASISWLSDRLDLSQLDCLVWAAYYCQQGKDFGAAAQSVPESASYHGAMAALGDKLALWQFASTGCGKAYGMSSEGLDRNWMYQEAASVEMISGSAQATQLPDGWTAVRMGSRGANTLWVQRRLNANGFCLEEDGIAGARTIFAVKEYQRLHGLTVDGIVGLKTRESLEQSSQPTRFATSWEKTGNPAAPAEIVSGGIYYPVFDQDRQPGAYAEKMDRQGCSICAAASAARKAGLEIAPAELYCKALALTPVGAGQIDTITVYGICLLLRDLGIPATWCGIQNTKVSLAASELVIRDALRRGQTVAVTVQAGADQLFTTSTVHTILLVGFTQDGVCIAANSNGGGRVQGTTVREVLDHAICGSIQPEEQTCWFGAKRTSCGFCVIG